MRDPIKLLHEIKADYLKKFDNDPTIRRICNTIIQEFELRSKE